MLLLTLNVLYVLLAIGMIALILMQRGAGAQAGSGFGGGASATVFGSRGASNFLSKSTKWMAIVFFAISLFMAWNATRMAAKPAAGQPDLGVMAQVPAAPATNAATVPAAPVSTVPAAPAAVPPANNAAPASAAPAPAEPQPQQQAPAQPVPQGG